MDHSQPAKRARLRAPTHQPRAARVYQIVFANRDIIETSMECVPRVHRERTSQRSEMLLVFHVLPRTPTPTLSLRHLQV